MTVKLGDIEPKKMRSLIELLISRNLAQSLHPFLIQKKRPHLETHVDEIKDKGARKSVQVSYMGASNLITGALAATSPRVSLSKKLESRARAHQQTRDSNMGHGKFSPAS